MNYRSLSMIGESKERCTSLFKLVSYRDNQLRKEQMIDYGEGEWFMKMALNIDSQRKKYQMSHTK